MSRPPAPSKARSRYAAGARVYVLRVWADMPPAPAFRALVRPVESEQWLGFTSTADLLAYLLRRDAASGKDGP